VRASLGFLRCQSRCRKPVALDGRRGIDSIRSIHTGVPAPGTRCTSFTGGQVDRLSGRNASTLVKALNLSHTLFLFELEINSTFADNPPKLKQISKFPSVRRDLAVVVDESVPLAVLRENVTVSASGLLSELRVFDVYRGSGVELGRKSVALGLILQDSSRTLTDVDADAVVASVVTRLRDVLSAAIRDQ